MERSQPTREILPLTPKPGVEVVYKRFSRLPEGGIVCTVSYVESKKKIPVPIPKKTLLVRIADVFSRVRMALSAKLSRLRATRALYRALEGGRRI
jgi:hypothetical protein